MCGWRNLRKLRASRGSAAGVSYGASRSTTHRAVAEAEAQPVMETVVASLPELDGDRA